MMGHHELHPIQDNLLSQRKNKDQSNYVDPGIPKTICNFGPILFAQNGKDFPNTISKNM